MPICWVQFPSNRKLFSNPTIMNTDSAIPVGGTDLLLHLQSSALRRTN